LPSIWVDANPRGANHIWQWPMCGGAIARQHLKFRHSKDLTHFVWKQIAASVTLVVSGYKQLASAIVGAIAPRYNFDM